ncbi:MAG TPA: hypothetical protein PKG54_05505 [Phycisphaerae bacterium]|jgi:hypothetical protein|nr:hypothetical protein [Phycisphaerae bacterium]HOB73965.1 hypothetical protein [Phycisphaerae bacterium]HOJ55353.1 hypothetical protein [Phycisphaerae bacterium]HOL25106.1 hypothetical protein [Phycisphaerae bacterium]HPP19718.1 hypothetical protein [Phycisphaerae bacterium]
MSFKRLGECMFVKERGQTLIRDLQNAGLVEATDTQAEESGKMRCGRNCN